jgi:hypothetical protein
LARLPRVQQRPDRRSLRALIRRDRMFLDLRWPKSISATGGNLMRPKNSRLTCTTLKPRCSITAMSRSSGTSATGERI